MCITMLQKRLIRVYFDTKLVGKWFRANLIFEPTPVHNHFPEDMWKSKTRISLDFMVFIALVAAYINLKFQAFLFLGTFYRLILLPIIVLTISAFESTYLKRYQFISNIYLSGVRLDIILVC